MGQFLRARREQFASANSPASLLLDSFGGVVVQASEAGSGFSFDSIVNVSRNVICKAMQVRMSARMGT